MKWRGQLTTRSVLSLWYFFVQKYWYIKYSYYVANKNGNNNNKNLDLQSLDACFYKGADLLSSTSSPVQVKKVN